MIRQDAVTALCFARQRLGDPVSVEDYDALFRRMSPVRTVYWCCPGSPPVLSLRAAFDDAAYVFDKRRARVIVKGRFQGGGLAYVFADELPLYAAVYRREAPSLTRTEERLMDLLTREGPMSVGQIKEYTGMLAKEITPALHALQERFWLFEDQADSEWDRAFYPFDSEFPTLDMQRYSRAEALGELLCRFAYLTGVFDPAMARDFYRLPLRDIQAAAAALCEAGRLCAVDGEVTGYGLTADMAALTQGDVPAPSGVYALQRNDFLVKAQESALKGRFQRDGCDVLYYLLIDGRFQGAVMGHFKNGPFVIEDLVFELDEAKALARRDEILAAVDRVCPSADSPVPRYAGQPLG